MLILLYYRLASICKVKYLELIKMRDENLTLYCDRFVTDSAYITHESYLPIKPDNAATLEVLR
ncbi:hypothetical protein VP249E411_P0272 [Vibrio phage 249E41-1]|nr:hypothetical protein VP249E411_P0272 [Vibrio phage 249E41-1]CAH9017588.1 hypothetical protein VP193E371_P0271 [Vibrio phage 193E37-1]